MKSKGGDCVEPMVDYGCHGSNGLKIGVYHFQISSFVFINVFIITFRVFNFNLVFFIIVLKLAQSISYK